MTDEEKLPTEKNQIVSGNLSDPFDIKKKTEMVSVPNFLRQKCGKLIIFDTKYGYMSTLGKEFYIFAL